MAVANSCKDEDCWLEFKRESDATFSLGPKAYRQCLICLGKAKQERRGSIGINDFGLTRGLSGPTV